MARCEVCRKGRIFGTTHRHHRGVAGGQWLQRAQRTLKIFKPNLHTVWVVRNGGRVKVKLCTKCLRLVKAKQRVKLTPKTSSPQAAAV